MTQYFKPNRKKPETGVGLSHGLHTIIKSHRKLGFLYQVHVADGFVDDCDEIVLKCSKIQPLTFQAFANIWKEMNFGSIYQGRTMGAEVIELSEEIIHIAKRFMIKDTGNYEEQVAGLFLVYGLINLQPYKRMAPLRLVPDDVAAINRIEMIARRDRRLEVLYVLGHVLIKGPVQYHASEREHGMEISLRKYQEGLRGINVEGVRPKGVFYRQNEELDMLQELKNVSKIYSSIKSSLKSEKPDRGLSYANDNVFDEAHTKLKKIIDGDVGFDDPCFGPSESEKRSNKISEIKNRAMKNYGKFRGIEIAIAESTTSTENNVPDVEQNTCVAKPKNNKNSGLTKTPGRPPKIARPISPPESRSSLKRSPKSSIRDSLRRSPRLSPQKTKNANISQPKSNKQIMSKKKYSSSSDPDTSESESDLSLASDDEETDEDEEIDDEEEGEQEEVDKDKKEEDQQEQRHMNTSFEIDVAEYKRLKESNVIKDVLGIQTFGNVEVLGSMPIVITSGPSQEYEVEIIDQMLNPTESGNIEKIQPMPEEIKKKKRGRPPKNPQNVEKTEESAQGTKNIADKKKENDVFKKPNSDVVPRKPLKRCEKREKSVIMSKFRKLGLETVAIPITDDKN